MQQIARLHGPPQPTTNKEPPDTDHADPPTTRPPKPTYTNPFAHLAGQPTDEELWDEATVPDSTPDGPDDRQDIKLHHYPSDVVDTYRADFHQVLDVYLDLNASTLQHHLAQGNHEQFIQTWAFALEQATFDYTQATPNQQRRHKGRGEWY